MDDVGGNVICCDTPPVPLRICIAKLPRNTKRVGDREPLSADAATSTSVLAIMQAGQLSKKMQRNRGASELEPSGDECADADDIDEDTLGGVRFGARERRISGSGGRFW